MPQVTRVERLAAILVALATALSLLLWDGAVTFGVAVGGMLAALNFFALRRLVQGVVNTTSMRKQAILVVLLTAKFGVLAALIYLAIRFLPINSLALLVGISVVVVSIFIEGFRASIAGAEPQSE